jgi:hypothetical protein
MGKPVLSELSKLENLILRNILSNLLPVMTANEWFNDVRQCSGLLSGCRSGVINDDDTAEIRIYDLKESVLSHGHDTDDCMLRIAAYNEGIIVEWGSTQGSDAFDDEDYKVEYADPDLVKKTVKFVTDKMTELYTKYYPNDTDNRLISLLQGHLKDVQQAELPT